MIHLCIVMYFWKKMSSFERWGRGFLAWKKLHTRLKREALGLMLGFLEARRRRNWAIDVTATSSPGRFGSCSVPYIKPTFYHIPAPWFGVGQMNTTLIITSAHRRQQNLTSLLHRSGVMLCICLPVFTINRL